MPSKLTKDSPVTDIYGCGQKKSQMLRSLGILTAGDILRHFPRGYQHRGDVKELSENNVGKTASFVLTVTSAPVSSRINGGKMITKCKAFDGLRSCTLIYFNQKYMRDVLIVGNTYRFWGKLVHGKTGLMLTPITTEPVTETKSLAEYVPVYPSTKGLTQGSLRSLIEYTLENITIDGTNDVLPPEIRSKLEVCGEYEAYRCIHKPDSEQMIENGRLTAPVKDINIIGNGPQALADIVAVGNDLRIDNGTWTCGKDQSVAVSCGIPTVLIRRLTVGGE